MFVFQPDLDKPDNWKLYAPEDLVDHMVVWYHVCLGHTGSSNLFKTINTLHYNPRLRKQCEELISSCDVCQVNKPRSVARGKMPPREALLMSWTEVRLMVKEVRKGSVNSAKQKTKGMKIDGTDKKRAKKKNPYNN